MKNKLFALSVIMTCSAFGENYWTGGGTTTDWTDSGNWYQTGGNWVFGGGQVGLLVDGKTTVTFTNAQTISTGVWIENESHTDIVWKLGEGADAAAGLTTTRTANDSMTIGTGKHGGLTVESGTYSLPKQLWIGNGTGDSFFTLNGGVFTIGSYLCIAYGNGNTCTMTVNGGKFQETGGVLIVGQGNNANNHGILNITGGEVSTTGEATMSENRGRSEINISGGSLTVAGKMQIAQGKSGKAVSALTVTGGSYTNNGDVFAGGGNGSEATVSVSSGVLSAKSLNIGSSAASTATMTVSGGTVTTTTGRLIAGTAGTGTLIVNGGYVTWGDQLMAASLAGGVGSIVVNGGRLVRADRLVQIGLWGNGTFTMNGGETSCLGFRLASDDAAAVGAANLNDGTLTSSEAIFVCGKGTGTFNLNGGVVQTPQFDVGIGSGTLVLNGGTMQARRDEAAFIQNKTNLTVKLGEGGAVFDTAGYNVTVPATLANADGLVGNAPLAKKGLGTLTISSSLDLERAFTFTIDGGVGPIAFTGENTLGDGKKITVVIEPVSAETGTVYTVMTGLPSATTINDIQISINDFYVCTGNVTEGTLTVTLAYTPTAPVTGKYVDGQWGFYNGEGTLIENGTAASLTTYVFAGAEPAGELATVVAAGNRIVLEARLNGSVPVTNSINLASSVAANRVRIETDDGCAVRFVGPETEISFAVNTLVNNGTIVFDGKFALDALPSSGTVGIAEDAVVRLTKSQTLSAFLSGSGELVVAGGIRLTITKRAGSAGNEPGTELCQGFEGALTIGVDGELEDLTDLHGENANQGPYYFLGESTLLRMAGGTVTRFGGATNNENIKNVEIVTGTTNIWNNYQSRSGWTGCNVNITGTITGLGTLTLNSGGRGYRISDDLSGFGGTLDCSGASYTFAGGIKGGTVIFNANVENWSNSIRVDNATLLIKNQNPVRTTADGKFVIGATGVFGSASGATATGIAFENGAKLRLLDVGALSDKAQTYVALTSTTPISIGNELARTLIEQPADEKGYWRAVVETVPAAEENGDPTYRLCAEYRTTRGFYILFR